MLNRKKSLLQNAVFRPEREICALKKLAKTAVLTVLANFFFVLIFQDDILQQAYFLRCGLVWEESFPVRGVLLPSSDVLLIVFFLFRVHFLLGPFDQPGKR